MGGQWSLQHKQQDMHPEASGRRCSSEAARDGYGMTEDQASSSPDLDDG